MNIFFLYHFHCLIYFVRFDNFRKDDICFRRKKPKNTEFKDAATQCTNSLNELRKIDADPNEKIIEKNHRRDENHTNNPFSTKSKENHETKSNNLRNLDKNSSHRHQSRHQDDHINLRSKQSNQRSKENERRDQIDPKWKRRRSPSVSKSDHKRIRRSRSRSRSRTKRNVHDRNSPDKKVSRNAVGILLIHSLQRKAFLL